MSRKELKVIMSTTNLDLHNERFTKEDLEVMLIDYKYGNTWMYWNHLTTLPPLGFIEPEKVSLQDSGEFALEGKGVLFDQSDYQIFSEANIPLELPQTLPPLIYQTFDVSEIQIGYDRVNYSQDQVSPIIHAVNEIIPTIEKQIIRKAVIPDPVIWIAIALATGFLARVGERIADKAIDASKEKVLKIGELIKKVFSIPKKPDDKPITVILGIPNPDTEAIIEAAIENADENVFQEAWNKLPDLLTIIDRIMGANPKDRFKEIKYLFNPLNRNWEINYIITGTNRVILGPRYTEPDHPLNKSWLEMRKRIDAGYESLGVSVSVTKIIDGN